MVRFVLLHYFGGSALSWGPFAEALGRPCMIPDLRGFGDAPAGGAMDVAAYADDAEALVEGIGPFVLVGHSMGGKVATALAARRPAGLSALVLVAPSPPGPEPMAEAARQKLLASWGNRAGAEDVAEEISIHRDGPVFDRIVDDHLRASEAAWEAWLEHGSREDIRTLTSNVAVPVLVAAADGDAALGPDAQRRHTLPFLPAPRMEVIEGSRHAVPLDQPARLAAVVRDWASQAGPA